MANHYNIFDFLNNGIEVLEQNDTLVILSDDEEDVAGDSSNIRDNKKINNLPKWIKNLDKSPNM